MLTEQTVQLPQFATTVRGYDRAQVDSYVERLLEHVQACEVAMEAASVEASVAREETALLRERLTEIERREFTSTPESFRALGDRVGRVLESALEAADELRSTAESDVRIFVTEREHYSRSLVARAEERHEELVTAAREAVQSVLDAGEMQRRGVSDDIARLAQVRRSVIDEIGSLRELLARAVEESTPGVDLAALPELPSGPEVEASTPEETGAVVQGFETTALIAVVTDATPDAGPDDAGPSTDTTQVFSD